MRKLKGYMEKKTNPTALSGLTGLWSFIHASSQVASDDPHHCNMFTRMFLMHISVDHTRYGLGVGHAMFSNQAWCTFYMGLFKTASSLSTVPIKMNIGGKAA